MDRICILDDTDLTDMMGCYVFVMREGIPTIPGKAGEPHLICVACNGKHGGNMFSAQEFAETMKAFNARHKEN